MVNIVIITEDFTAGLEGYVNKSSYLEKYVPSEQHFSKGEQESWL